MGNDVSNWSSPSPPAGGPPTDDGEDIRQSLDRIAQAQERIERDHARLSRTVMDLAPGGAFRSFAYVAAVVVLASQQLPELLVAAGLPGLAPYLGDRLAAIALIAALAALAVGVLSGRYAERRVDAAAARIASLVEEPVRPDGSPG